MNSVNRITSTGLRDRVDCGITTGIGYLVGTTSNQTFTDINQGLNMNTGNRYIVISTNGTASSIALPYTPELLNVLNNSKTIAIERDYSNKITGIFNTGAMIEISIIHADAVQPQKPDRKEQLAKMTALKEKLSAEIESLDKEISTL